MLIRLAATGAHDVKPQPTNTAQRRLSSRPHQSVNQPRKRRTNMKPSLSRRAFVASAMAMVAAPAVSRGAAAADEPLTLRCSLETAPSHTRNAIIRDYLGKIESAAGGQINTQLFESGQLFPDLQVGKALLQGQVEMAARGSCSRNRSKRS